MSTRPDAAPDAPLSAGRRRLFTGLMLLLPVLFFVLLEGGLRLGGYGDDYPLFDEAPGLRGYLTPSRTVATRYFAREASVPTPNADYFRADKPEGTFRIVVQGGSSAAGFPFYRGGSFPQMLAARLRLAYPEREIEVVNTAMAAVNSYTLLDLADEILEQAPDVVVIYAGHNEYYGALGAASTESIGRSPGLVRTYLRLRRFRTVQLVRNVAASVAGAFAPERPAGAPPSNTLMARMIGEQSVPLGGETYRAGRQQFAQNLDLLLARYAEAGVPVYISTLASNERDQRPFVTAFSAGTDTSAVGEALREGQASLASGDTAAALVAFERAASLDTLAAGPQYALGRVRLALGQADAAREALTKARDLDALRFRAPAAFNDLIRETAARHGAVLVDGEAAVRDMAPDAIIGDEAMLEHLHPTLDGYAALADAFFEAFAAEGLVGETPRPTPSSRVAARVTPMDSLAGHLRVARLTSTWPYRPGEDKPVRLDSARTPPFVVGLTERVMDGANWVSAADTLAQFYRQIGRLGDARITLESMAQLYPFLPKPWSDLGALELAQANETGAPTDRAERLYQEALRRDADHFPALAMLGAIRLQEGQRTDAIRLLERAQAVAPRSPQVLYNLAGAYMLDGRPAEAVPLAERLVAEAPGNPAYQAFLAQLRQAARSSGSG